MDFEIDRFYEERKAIRSSGPLNLHTIIVAVGLHLAAFVLFWIAAKIIYRAPEVVIPIDMTIVPPWAEQDPDDPEPDPKKLLKPKYFLCKRLTKGIRLL